uniref:Secreted protein n=1 Tax=Paramormyrops kingsleyae TaxID=1676925 RepID=A0A3B3R9G4_9TELE
MKSLTLRPNTLALLLTWPLIMPAGFLRSDHVRHNERPKFGQAFQPAPRVQGRGGGCGLAERVGGGGAPPVTENRAVRYVLEHPQLHV